MIPEFGLITLIAALGFAIAQSAIAFVANPIGLERWTGLVRPLTYLQTVSLALCFVFLAASFLSDDFSVNYVAQNSNTHLPWIYKICAVWGAHEGSLLLWVVILAFWSSAVARFSYAIESKVVHHVLGVLGLISIGFLWFMLATSNPFLRTLVDVPLQGRDLNPLLQDPGLVSHPPMLYMGYVGFAVAYAFAIAALLNGRLDAVWARWCRPWTLWAWSFLSAGITLGSWWAYRELGWGGWWFWDPVENASLMPWLAGTALLHALIVTDKRGGFKSWTALLAIITFSLSLIGTFLVRSGVLISVHAFASDPLRGIFILKFLFLTIGGSLALFAWRASEIRAKVNFTAVSREAFLLYNNIILVVAMATILLGTVYPIALDSLGLAKISVGPPYFNTLCLPMFSLLMLLLGLGPLCQWKQYAAKTLMHRVKYRFAVVMLIAVSAPVLVTNKPEYLAGLGLFLSLWVLASAHSEILHSMRHGQSIKQKLGKLTQAQIGMHIAHLGVAVCAIGVALTSVYSTQRDVRMQPGDSLKLANFGIQWLSSEKVNGPNYTAVRAHFRVSRDRIPMGDVYPEKRLYDENKNPMTDADTFATLFYDIYIALADKVDDTNWAVRLYYKPFIRWIWIGGLLMMLGGLLASLDKRLFKKVRVGGN